MRPTRPTFFMSYMLAMPCTTVQKMIGAMIILIILMKASPSGFICSPMLGIEVPECDTDRDRGQHLHIEAVIEGLCSRVRLPPPLHAPCGSSPCASAGGSQHMVALAVALWTASLGQKRDAI